MYRSRTDRMVGGVCGGLSKYYSLDPIVTRLIFVVLALVDGVGILLYLILLVIIKEEPGEKVDVDTGAKTKEFINEAGKRSQEVAKNIKTNQSWIGDKRNLIALLIIVVGIALLLKQLFPERLVHWEYVWPGILIVFGFYLITRHNK